MYAAILHAHQKIDHVAYRHFRRLAAGAPRFPKIRSVLHFEGKYGPDGAKFKRKPNVDQPWHFVDPLDPTDTQLGKVIQAHFDQLVAALTESNTTRSSFEAAWLAHALVDGLTPAHHYPYEAQLEHLHGTDRDSRKGLWSRLVVKGETRLQSISKSLKVVGPKGLLTTHTMFEAGAFMIIEPLRLRKAFPSADDIAAMQQLGLVPYFQQQAREVAEFGMYTLFYEAGWTPQLARLVRRELAPRMVRIVTLAWYTAYQTAEASRDQAKS